MYAEFGSIERGYEIFQKMPQRDVVTWGAMISSFSIYGQAQKCFQLFDEMLADGIHPNKVHTISDISVKRNMILESDDLLEL